MAEPTQDKHHDEKFEFPLWKLIQQYGEEKDISYGQAADVMQLEYANKLRYRDLEFEEAEINKRRQELNDMERGVYRK